MLPGSLHCTSCDKALSVSLLLFSVLGLLGNTAACAYFRSNEKTGLAPWLYTLICTVDIVTSLTGFPVAVSLFLDRKPVMFNSQVFCTTWNLTFRYLQIISMYLVLLLSVTRCILISFPFYKIRKQAVLASVLLYTVFLMLKNLVVAVTPSLNLISQYSSDVAYCYDWFGKNGTRSGMMIKYVAFVVEAGVPPILTFFSFLITVYKIRSCSESESYISRLKRKSVSVMSASRKGVVTWKTRGKLSRKRFTDPTDAVSKPWRRNDLITIAECEDITTSASTCTLPDDRELRMRRFALIQARNKHDKVTSTRMTSIIKEKRKASITVAIFTSIFLFCNLPFFIVVVKDIVDLKSYYDDLSDSSSEQSHAATSLYIAGYTWILSRLHFTVLNAMLNPIMYYFRMDGFRFWLLRNLKIDGGAVSVRQSSRRSLLGSSVSQDSRRSLRRNVTI